MNATFLKVVEGGVLIIANAQDPNHHHYPLAFGVADGEKKESWIQETLLAWVLHENYYRLSLLLSLSSTYNSSYVWTRLSDAQPLLTLGIRQKVHYGYEVTAWEDPWILKILVKPASYGHPKMTVTFFIQGEPKEWNLEILENLIFPEDIPLIQSFYWSYTKKGQYSVNSG